MSVSVPTAPEALAKFQTEALEAIKSYQAQTLAGVEAWTKAIAKVAPATPAMPEIPAEVKSVMVDPADYVESSYAFAAQVLELNKKFAHELIDVSKNAAKAPRRAAAKPAATTK